MKISRECLPLVGATALIAAAGLFVYDIGSKTTIVPSAQAQTQANAAATPLRWKPPTLSSPITLQAKADGTPLPTLMKNRDYIIQLPTNAQRLGGLNIVGGRNIKVIGGSIIMPTTHPVNDPDSKRRAIYIADNADNTTIRTVHIEGVLISNPNNTPFDGVAIAAPKANVQLQNMRVVGLTGSSGSAFHADVVQPWGGVNQLRIDRLTGFSNYQGLQLAPDLPSNNLNPIGSALIQNVNLRYTRRTSGEYGHLVWLTRGNNTCKTYPMALTEVYVEVRPTPTNSNVGTSAWPRAGSTDTPGCTGVLNGSKTEMQWSGLRNWKGDPLTLGGQGRVKTWSTGMGDFVSTNVGLGYNSPGYPPPTSSALSSPSSPEG